MNYILEGRASTREVWLDGKRLDLARGQRIVNHSPDGFNWGYSGSGPSQLALSVVLEITGRHEGYQDLKSKVIAGIPRGEDFVVQFEWPQ